MRGKLSTPHIYKRAALIAHRTFTLIPTSQKNQEQIIETTTHQVPEAVKTPFLGGPKLQYPEPGGPDSLEGWSYTRSQFPGRDREVMFKK